jgi:hypothetical protein
MMTVSNTATASRRWDRAGMLVSGACAVHCVLMPLLIGVVPVLGVTHLRDDRVEWTLIGAAAVLGIVGHLRAYHRNHLHVAPGVIFVVGFALIALGRAFLNSQVLEPLALGLGGVLAAASHYANLRMCRCCVDAEDPAD